MHVFLVLVKTFLRYSNVLEIIEFLGKCSIPAFIPVLFLLTSSEINFAPCIPVMGSSQVELQGGGNKRTVSVVF